MLKRFIAVSLLLVITFLTQDLFAGNHEVIHPTRGFSIGWQNSETIPYWTDAGGLGKLNNDQAVALVQKMMDTWSEASNAKVGFAYQGTLPHDVNSENIADYIGATSCGNTSNTEIPANVVPIVFDEDGSVIEFLTGVGSSGELGGITTLRCFEGSVSDPRGIFQGMVIINGQFIDNSSEDGSPADLTLNVMAGVMLHELGHLIGLDHTVVNDEIYDDISFGDRPAEDSRFLPIMLPTVLRESVASTTLHPDDLSALSVLYPADEYLASVGNIEGAISDNLGHEIRKVNVIARKVDDPLCEAVSTLSGRRCVPLEDISGQPNFNSVSCLTRDQYGDFKIEGLLPGDYTVEVEELSSGWLRSGMYPATINDDMPGDAEFYNENDIDAEDSYSSTNVGVVAGVATQGIDIILSSAVSSPEQLDRIPLDTFVAGPGTRCVTDPIDFDLAFENPGVDPSFSLEPEKTVLSLPAEESKGGCNLTGTAGVSSHLMIFLMLGLILRGLKCAKRFFS